VNDTTRKILIGIVRDIGTIDGAIVMTREMIRIVEKSREVE
jgi:hypothetical protein